MFLQTISSPLNFYITFAVTILKQLFKKMLHNLDVRLSPESVQRDFLSSGKVADETGHTETGL